ncbi:PTS sugar transporter subunit IIB [Photobacterium rosenbergii]|uniref:PTS sugar transporter subunit IIB n=1 Tax=Photobacterium rosenbergii TaxID=294936 RepID=A0ABU3ZNI1_9GAMM|nr:PTS sugar transporter subunit IIB [Photobacterium rosenbergii]MDV5171619.1 PTS sugar transporter subunit IIB [Photobacterium rosenbergii]
MKRILICCSAGMSARMVVNKMKFAADIMDVNVVITSVAMSEFESYVYKYDCFLLGPQVKHKFTDFKVITESAGKPIEVVNSMDYGMMNGKKILNDALHLIM